jgi:hypothetical protein
VLTLNHIVRVFFLTEITMVSAHLWYTECNGQEDVCAFECTLTVPIGGDPLNSYYMAVGWHRGYMGMQVGLFINTK